MKKMKKTVKFLTLAVLISGLSVLSSCQKEYAKYDNMEVVENNYTGTIYINSGGEDPSGDFEGDGNSGEYSFAWENPKTKAQVNFDVTTSGDGNVQMIINDAKGNEVLNVVRPEDGNDTFSGVSEEGKSGTWLVTLKLTDFNGDGSFSVNPGD